MKPPVSGQSCQDWLGSKAPRRETIDIAAIREKLAAARGPRYWQSLEELAQTEAFEDMLHREFPRQASVWDSGGAGRRKFLKLMGASLGLAGLTACTRQPTETIMPYVRAPEEIVPGKPLYYATAMQFGGVATGLLVESHMGRPTKVEGNPEHPGSLGATDIFSQASVLSLYDPDRSQSLTNYGEITSWTEFLGQFRGVIADLKAKGGAGIRILTETVTSPSLGAQLQQILKDFPQAKWHQWDPGAPHASSAGARMAFGEPVHTYYNFAAAKVILSLDADFLGCEPGTLRYSRDFAEGRRGGSMNRLYMAESTPTNTGAKADHRFPMKASAVREFAAAVAQGLGVAGATGQADVAQLVADLKRNAGAAIVIAGDGQPPAVHALAHAMNQALGNVGKTVFHTGPLEVNPVDQLESLRELVRDLEAGAVELLVIAGANPVYTAPADLNFASKFQRAKLRVRLGLYDDETSELCHWHIPQTHYLEAWGDTRGYDGTVTIQQPLIAPLYNGRSAYELLASFSDQPERSSYEVVRSYWQQRRQGADFERWWRRSVHDGVVPDTAAPPRNVTVRAGFLDQAPASRGGLEIIFRNDPTIHDGRFANNGWLQELPKPMSRLTWDNAAIMGPALAQKLELQNGDVVELRYEGRAVSAAAWIVPGHPPESVTAHLGYGRARGGRVAAGTGFDAYKLRTSGALWIGSGLEVRKTGGAYPIATDQGHWRTEGRNPVRSATVAEYAADENVFHEGEHGSSLLSLYPEFQYEGYAWGMAIDLSACTGCSACVVACQAENNIPVVGKDQVARGREMHWIRVDRYYEGDDLDNPETHFQPVPCMHCEKAPCEVVCPVEATAHSHEGLNDMVYNRCVGTRYCQNNCPYKVRRFNFYLYSDWTNPSVAMQKNPDVSVRSRGVMEKCTYCVQRINDAKITSEKEDRRIRDGEIQPACAQACPSRAIVFGDINDKGALVTRWKAEHRNYALLGELNTQPRTTYLGSLRNPNPEMEKKA